MSEVIGMTFDLMKQGYNRFQVDDALSKSQEEIDELNRKLEAYKRQGEEDRRRIQEYKEKINDLEKNMEARERAAKDMTRIALHEANSIVTTAHENADKIIRESLMNARAILNTISKLGIEASEIKENLNEQLQVLANSLEEFDIPPVFDVELLNSKYKE